MVDGGRLVPQRVEVEADLLGGTGDVAVVLGGVVGALLDVGDDEATGDVGHPVGEVQGVGEGQGQAPFGVVVRALRGW